MNHENPEASAPDVSIIIPFHTKESNIAHSIESIFSQTTQNVEIIIVDDCSEDTRETLNYEDSRVRVIEQENEGDSAARNRGVVEARSSRIIFLVAGEELQPSDLKMTLNLKERESKTIWDWMSGAK